MNAGMIRLGGILAFVLIAIFVVMLAFSASLAGNRLIATVIGIILYAIIIYVFWATKGLFNSKSYTSGDIPILGIIGLIVLSFLLSLIGGGGLNSMTNPQAMSRGAGVMGIIGLIVMLLWFALWLWFAIKAMGFSVAGGGLWKAIGILYLIATALILLGIVCVILALVAGSGGLAALAGIVMLIGMLVMLAAWICHGIGLITGASKI